MRHAKFTKMATACLTLTLLLSACAPRGGGDTTESTPGGATTPSERTTTPATPQTDAPSTETEPSTTATDPSDEAPETSETTEASTTTEASPSTETAESESTTKATTTEPPETTATTTDATETVTEPDTEATTAPTTEAPQPTDTEPSETEGPTGSDVPLADRDLNAAARERVLAMDNTPHSWSYIPAQAPFEEVPIEIPGDSRAILEKESALWKQPVEGVKRIYITMDHGYEFEHNTEEILDIAKEKDFPINCFLTGHFIDSCPDTVLRMVKEGHLVGNHTQNHLDQPGALEDGIDKLVNDVNGSALKFRELTGREMDPYLRPPAGGFSERSLGVLHEMGYTPVFWSFAYRDWLTDDQPDPEWALNKVTGDAFDGSVILLHSVSKTNISILGDLVDNLRSRGFVISRLDEATTP